MSERLGDIEALARMAARLAGRDPDEHLTVRLAGVVAFDDQLWRYPDFLTRAETAYEVLGGPTLVQREELNGDDVSARRGDGTRMAGSKVDGKALGSNQTG